MAFGIGASVLRRILATKLAKNTLSPLTGKIAKPIALRRARKNVRKELLNKDAYARYRENHLATSSGTKKKILLTEYKIRKKELAIKQSRLKRYQARQAPEDRKLPPWMQSNTGQKIEQLKDDIYFLKRGIDRHNPNPLSWSQYKRSVSDAINKTPALYDDLAKQEARWGVYHPSAYYSNPVYRSELPKSHQKIIRSHNPKTFKLQENLREYGSIASPRSVYWRDFFLPKGGASGAQNTVTHELKHAVQHNLKRRRGGASSSQSFLDEGVERFYKPSMKGEKLERFARPLGGGPAQVPIELSARVSQIKAMGPRKLARILKNPSKYKNISEVKTIGNFIGYNKKTWNEFFKKTWAFAPPGLLGYSEFTE